MLELGVEQTLAFVTPEYEEVCVIGLFKRIPTH